MVGKDELNTLAEVAKEVVRPMYEDGLKLATKEVGKSLQTIAGVVNIALMPVAVMVHGFKEIENKLKVGLTKKLEAVSPEKITAPSLGLVGPLLEKYKYNYNNEVLSDLFVNLLANGMNKDRVKDAHPAFIDIISQMTPDDARLFKKIVITKLCPKIDVGVAAKQGGHVVVIPNMLTKNFLEVLQYPDLAPSYLDNLQRLNLIQFSSGVYQEFYTNKELYTPLREDPRVKALEGKLDLENQSLKIMEGHIRVTSFGHTFFHAVYK